MFVPLHRADVESSLHLGIPTRLAVDEVEISIPRASTILSPSPSSCNAMDRPCHACAAPPLAASTLSPAFAALLHDATHAARLLVNPAYPMQLPCIVSSAAPQRKLSSTAVHGTFLLLAYRLQGLSPLLKDTAGPSTSTVVDDGAAFSLNIDPEHQQQQQQHPTSPIPSFHRAYTELEPERHEDTRLHLEQAIAIGTTAFIARFFGSGEGCGRLLGWVLAPARVVAAWAVGRVQGGCGQRGAWIGTGGDDANREDELTEEMVGEGEGRGRERGEEVEEEEVWVMQAVLWMAFIGVAARVFSVDAGTEGDGKGGVCDEWVVEMTRVVVGRLGLREWEDVERVLERFPWIHALHERAGRMYWDRCMGEGVGVGRGG